MEVSGRNAYVTIQSAVTRGEKRSQRIVIISESRAGDAILSEQVVVDASRETRFSYPFFARTGPRRLPDSTFGFFDSIRAFGRRA